MSLLLNMPNEILIQCLNYLQAQDLLSLLFVSSAIRLIASQDMLWEPHCEGIYNKGFSDHMRWRKISKAELLPSDHIDLPYHTVWRRMHLYEDLPGWWLPLDNDLSDDSIVSIKFYGQKITINSIAPTSNVPVGTPKTLIHASSWHDGQNNTLSIDPYPISIQTAQTGYSFPWLSSDSSNLFLRRHALTFHVLSGTSASNEVESSEYKAPHYMWLQHGSPSLFAAIQHSGLLIDEGGYASATGVPTRTVPWSSDPYIALRSPLGSSSAESLIENGLWVSFYGEDIGHEFIYIQTRKVSEADFVCPWGTEENSARAFDPELRELMNLDSELSMEDLRVGGDIIEAIKVTGDENVPCGVRTFVGFLDHRSAWSGAREEGDFVARPKSHPWPIYSDADTKSSTSRMALPTSLREMKDNDTPACGMTLPGLMRVAWTWFDTPTWRDATVHISNRKEIRLWLKAGSRVIIYYKVDEGLVRSTSDDRKGETQQKQAVQHGRDNEAETFVLGDDEDQDDTQLPEQGFLQLDSEAVRPLDNESTKELQANTSTIPTDPSLPTSPTYYIKSRDTVAGIALRYGIDPRHLCRLNKLPTSTLTTTPHLLHTRTTLQLPPGSRAPSPPPPDLQGRLEARARERAGKAFQSITKETDWGVAQTYVALLDVEDDDIKEGKRRMVDSKSSQGRHALAVDSYLDDNTWEEEQIRAGLPPHIEGFPYFEPKGKENIEPQNEASGSGSDWWQKLWRGKF